MPSALSLHAHTRVITSHPPHVRQVPDAVGDGPRGWLIAPSLMTYEAQWLLLNPDVSVGRDQRAHVDRISRWPAQGWPLRLPLRMRIDMYMHIPCASLRR